MYMLPLMGGAVEYLSGKPCPHGTLLGLIPPTAVSIAILISNRFIIFKCFHLDFRHSSQLKDLE